MEYFAGAALALAAAVFAALSGHDRDRAFYPRVLVAIALFYDLFAVMAGDVSALGAEAVGTLVFAGLAFVGFRTSLWVIVAALGAHGLFDLVHGDLIADPGVPTWWPTFCMAYDLAAAAGLAARLLYVRAPDLSRAAQGRPS